MKRNEFFLQHIFDEIVFLREVGRRLTYDGLLAVRQRAIIRSIEIILDHPEHMTRRVI